MCNQSQYIDEQRLALGRLAVSANIGTAASAEWKRLAAVMDEQEAMHRALCDRCRGRKEQR
jgi:hypothetical protein